jgi:hypothetical protein
MVPDKIVQTPVVAEAKVTVKPLDDVAEIAYVPVPSVLLFRALKVIVWDALLGVDDAVNDAVPVPAALIADTLNV